MRGVTLSAQWRFAHLSDWHATTLVGGGPSLLRGKRISGWASWGLSRRHRHSAEVLAAAFRDVQSQAVDRILVTGDLTHVSLEQEFRKAAEQLAALGTPENVFLVPGNHDCYVRVPPERSWDLWSPYLSGLDPMDLEPEIGACLVPHGGGGRAPRHEQYPTLRIHGRLAMIGLCSAIPTPIFRAGGELGAVQLDRLERLLGVLRDRNFCRVIMIHHPVAQHGEPARRALWDGDEFRAVLARAGAELVIHGHKHRRRVAYLPGPEGEIAAVGVPSSSEVGSRPEKRAQYHVYTVRSADSDRRFQIDAEIRGYDSASGAYRSVEEPLLTR
jgi:3',5'-cyclic AMP phosphodiesterase CpdA